MPASCSPTALVLGGEVVHLARHAGEHPDFRVFSATSRALQGAAGIARSAFEPTGRGLIQLGLLVLVATPVARVVSGAPDPARPPRDDNPVGLLMQSERTKLVIVVRPGARTQSILGWLRQLVPAALLVVAAVNLPPPIPPEVIVLDEEEVASGPLSLADVLTRRWAPSREPIIGGGDDLASRPVPPRS